MAFKSIEAYYESGDYKTTPEALTLSSADLRRRREVVDQIETTKGDKRYVAALIVGDFTRVYPSVASDLLRIVPAANLETDFNILCGMLPDIASDNLRCPFVWNDADPSSVDVFVNLAGYGTDFPASLQYNSLRLQNRWVQRTILDIAIRTLRSPRALSNWVESTETLRATALRKETMGLARYLARYTDISRPSNVLRDLQESRVSSTGSKVILHKVATEADACEMYSSGPTSCMMLRDGHSRAFRWMFDEGTHPTAIFHYYPRALGVYVKRGSEVGARCFLYDFSTSNDWSTVAIGRVYATSDHQKALLYKAIRDEYPGAKGMTGGESWGIMECSFTIPAISHENTKVFPFPYMDNLALSCFAKYNEGEDTFTILFKSGSSAPEGFCILDRGRTAGFYSRDEITVVRCASCSDTLYPGYERYSHISRPLHFCSVPCIRSYNGVTAAYRSDGVQVVVDEGECVADALDPSRQYTNLEALRAHNALPARSEDVFIMSEDDAALSTSGASLEINGMRIRYPDSIRPSILVGNRLTSEGMALLATNGTLKIDTTATRLRVDVPNYEPFRFRGGFDEAEIDAFEREDMLPVFDTDSPLISALRIVPELANPDRDFVRVA